jgi:nitric oxide reductase subunit B
MEKRSLMVSRAWVQTAGLVMLFGFFIMGLLTYYTYSGEPPIPNTIRDSGGKVLFARSDVLTGQQIFLGNGLMKYLCVRSRRLSRA